MIRTSKIKFIKFIFITIFLFVQSAFAETVNQIQIIGNERIPSETIKTFSDLKKNDDLDDNKINDALKSLYDSNFFKNVSIEFKDGKVTITVVENPIIQNLEIEGVKAQKIRDQFFDNLELKQKGSFFEEKLKSDLNTIKKIGKNLGYYFIKVEALQETLDGNKINITFNVDLGEKAKISKISFVGNKIFKDSKLKSVIVSEEYKFWKFISGKKFLNENLVKLDLRLLKNFYLNKGYYDVEINSSFAKMISENEFELIFNIESNKKIFFGDLSLKLPIDFKKDNFTGLEKLFRDVKGEPYSITVIEKILDEIDLITITEQFESVKANVIEELISDKINLIFQIEDTEKLFVEKINIFGNNITNENVIRNQLLLDEGDPYNQILSKRSINNIKGLNFFKSVKSEILEGSNPETRVLNIEVEEKATGEISAGAGVGTSGGTIMFGVKENNYLGKGIAVNTNFTVNAESLKGIFSVRNPNYNNTDKSAFFSLEATETDRLKNSGYKMNKTGLNLGTRFEYFDDLFLGFKTSTFFETIETNSTASARQKAQKGNYFDSFLGIDFDFDKRNQKFQTNQGFRSLYKLKLPLVSDTNTLTNFYSYKYFTELYENNISTVSLYLKSVNSITDEDVKLSERAFIPSNRLRGFVSGKVGPKDGDDFIGGNYITTLNFSSTLPFLFENSQNTDFLIFMDVANIWGVDYDASLDSSNKIRSAIGVGVDYFTPVGPLNFSLTEVISKSDTDRTEGFRFNLGTTF